LNPNKKESVPINEVSNVEFEEDVEEQDMSKEEREEIFAKFKKEQELKLKSINPNMNIFDFYFKDIKTLDNLKEFLHLKGRKIFRHKMMERAPISIKEEQKKKWIIARENLVASEQQQGIHKELDEKEIRRPETSAGLVTKFDLEKLNKMDRDILANVIIDVIDMKNKIGTAVAGKFALAKKRKATQHKNLSNVA